MECPKCHIEVDENQAVCPKCHKVLLLECPNCHSLGESSVCQKCGYTILVKCSKCGKTVPVTKELCKCGFPTETSVAYQECESDDFASIIVKIGSLKTIRRLLKSQELYTKFFFRLKNLLYAQVNGVDCKFIAYGDTFVINMNKELSLATSSNKAIRLALKIVNSLVGLNNNILQELGVPLNISLTIIKKSAESLQKLMTCENNVKPLNIKKDSKRYLKGFQIILDQHIRDEVNKDYKTDSLYSLENNGKSMMFYEVILDSYVLPPEVNDETSTIQTVKRDLNKVSEIVDEEDIYSFKVFDINAKCSFVKTNAVELFDKLNNIDLNKQGKIIAIKTEPNNNVLTADIVDFYQKNDYRVLNVNCSEELSYKPWGFFETLFKEYFELPFHNKFIDLTKINENSMNLFKPLFELIIGKSVKAMSAEDARFSYMELWNKFLSVLSNTVILVDGFENIDDTSLQTLELYFDSFKTVKPNFVFVTSDEVSVHSKIKGLLRTNIYTEFSLKKCSLDLCLSTIKSDATDFIQSFYFEKIKENFSGSYLYFKNAIEYLKDTGVLIDFENKLLIKNKKSVIIPKNLQGLYKSRMKHLSKNVDLSFVLAYISILGSRLDMQTLSALGIKDVEKNIENLIETGLVYSINGVVYLNNYPIVTPVVSASLKKSLLSLKQKQMFLYKNLILVKFYIARHTF